MPSLTNVYQDGSRRKVRAIGAGAACKRRLDVSVHEQDDRVSDRAVTPPVSAAVAAVGPMELA